MKNEFKAELEYNFESGMLKVTKITNVNGLKGIENCGTIPFNTENTMFDKNKIKDNILLLKNKFKSNEELDEFVESIKKGIPLENKMIELLKNTYKDNDDVKSFGVAFIIDEEDDSVFVTVDINDKPVLDWDFPFCSCDDEEDDKELLNEVLSYVLEAYIPNETNYTRIISFLDEYEELINDPEDFAHKNYLNNNSYKIFREIFEKRCKSVLKQYNNDEERAFDTYSMKNNILNYINVYINDIFDITITNIEYYSKKELNRILNNCYQILF